MPADHAGRRRHPRAARGRSAKRIVVATPYLDEINGARRSIWRRPDLTC